MIMNTGTAVAALFARAKQQGRDPTPGEVKDSLKNLDDRLEVAEGDIKDLQKKTKPTKGKPPAGD